MEELRVALFQHAPRFGEVAGNVAAVAAAAAAAPSDVLLTPELSLTGYDVRDRAPSLAIPLDRPGDVLAPLLEARCTIVTGLIEAARDGAVYNAAVVFHERGIVHVHRKIYLPTYGMFDEMRYFARGASLDVAEIHGWRLGILVCEDFWHPGLIYALATRGIDALLVLSAGPGRGVWEGGAHGDFASSDVWEGIACTTARLYGVYVALANRVGVEGGLTFAGGSLIVAPDGQVMTRAPSHEEVVLNATFSRRTLHRARQPYFHNRDDDPSIVLRALARP